MSESQNSCSDCCDLRLLLDKKNAEIDKLKSQIQNLNTILRSNYAQTCQFCNCKTVINNHTVEESERDQLKSVKCGLSQHDGLFLHSTADEQYSGLTINNYYNSDIDSSKTKKSDEEIESHKDSNSDKEEKSSKEYVYDDNYKMYYCTSTGYYYDRNTGLYYVPQNGAYYTYDYSNNAYVLYNGEQTEVAHESNNTTHESKQHPDFQDNIIDKTIDPVVIDHNKTDDSCESVVDQVNNLSIKDADFITNTQQISKDKSENDYDSEKLEYDCRSEMRDNETDSNFTKDWQPPDGTNLTVQDMVREVAEQNAGMSDYVFDEKSRMYYSQSTGYYYDAARNLLYDPQSGTYYTYDEESSTYNFYYQLDLTSVAASNNYRKGALIKDSKKKARRRYWRKKQIDHGTEKMATQLKQEGEKDIELETDIENDNYSSPEEGELFSSDSEEDIIQTQELLQIESTPIVRSPCIRAIVKTSEELKIGTLLLITCMGGIIGRDKSNAVFIPDNSVSKVHAEITFNDELWKYSIKDLGSQNGTFVNDARLSEPKEVSLPHFLCHGDNISVGSCKLMLHIHVGYETCDECEPGQIMAELSSQEGANVFMTKEEKEKERRQEVRRLKKKYGLQGMGYEECKNSILPSNSGYEDKAAIRRKVIGSENPYEKTEASSMERIMEKSNKGYQMLKKLGWKEGESLGATGHGISEPIPLRPWLTKAGLGSTVEQQASMQLIPEDRRKQKWVKAQERFFRLS